MKKTLLISSLTLTSFMAVGVAKPKTPQSRSKAPTADLKAIFSKLKTPQPKPKVPDTDLKAIFSKLKVKSLSSPSRISNIASRDVGTFYKRGVGLQCANYVSHVVERAGGNPPAGKASARSWLKWGRKVSRANLRPGDIIVTSRGRSSRSGHILIYKGNGKAIHRSTKYKPIGEIPLNYYSSRIIGIRRIS